MSVNSYMKHLEIYADGVTNKNGSGFGVILLSLNKIWKRAFPTGGSSANASTLNALKFGLLSISESYKDFKIKIYLKNKYTRDILAKDDDGFYKMNPKVNKEIIEDIRALLNNKEYEILNGKDVKMSEECKKIIEKSINDNETIDKRN